MQVEKTNENIDPFYAEIKGRVFMFQINSFMGCIDAVRRRMKVESDRFFIYASKEKDMPGNTTSKEK